MQWRLRFFPGRVGCPISILHLDTNSERWISAGWPGKKATECSLWSCTRNWKCAFLLREAISLRWTSAILCLPGLRMPELFLQWQKSWYVKLPLSAKLPLSSAGCWHRLLRLPLYFLRSLLVERDWTSQFLFVFLLPPPFLLKGFKDIWGDFLCL